MIEFIRKRVIEETANFLIVDIDMDDFAGSANLEMMEVFLSEGLRVLDCESYTHTENRGWFRFNTYKHRCRVFCQKMGG